MWMRAGPAARVLAGAQADKVVVAGFDGGRLRGDGGLPDREFGGIQPDQRGGFGEFNIDIDGAGKGLFTRYEGELGGVPGGAYVVGEAKFRSFGGEGGASTKHEGKTGGTHRVHGIAAAPTHEALRW